MSPALNDLTGQRFGRLTVIRKAGGKPLLKWLCRCDCGAEKIVLGQSLRNGDSQSCGCLQKELFGAASAQRETTHGDTVQGNRTPEYRSWAAMLSRCYNHNATGFHNYGGRGVKVCDRWRRSYADFLADKGRRPSLQHTLDRYPDPDGNYEPTNCRWATKREQRQNQRKRTSDV